MVYMRRAEQIKVTPEMASMWLERNTRNRNISPTLVARYARDMAAFNWDVNGETIKIDKNGDLVDGQHRLLACVQAGVPFESYVVTGLEIEARNNVDTGRVRGLGDMLRMEGHANAAALAAAVSMAWGLEQGVLRGAYTPTRHEAAAWLESNPTMVDAIAPASRIRKELRGINGTVAATLLFGAGLVAESADVWVFTEQLVLGEGLRSTDAAYALRRWAVNNLGARKAMRVDQLAIAIKAWNAYIDGRQVATLVWRQGGAAPEAFPVHHGPFGQWPGERDDPVVISQ